MIGEVETGELTRAQMHVFWSDQDGTDFALSLEDFAVVKLQSSCQFQPISSWNGGGIGSNKYGLCKWTVTKTCLPTRRQEKLVDTYFTVNVFLYKEAYSGNVCQTGSSQSVLIKAVVVKLV